MNMLDALSSTDIISLILLILIAIIVFRFSVSGNQVHRSTADRDSALTGGDQIEPDPWFQEDSATDTNDPVLLAHNSDSRYAGPNQTALALAMLDDSQQYSTVTGHIPADLPVFLDHSSFPTHLGSNDPAALASLILLDPAARFGEEVSDDPSHPALATLRGLAIALVVLALLYRLIFF